MMASKLNIIIIMALVCFVVSYVQSYQTVGGLNDERQADDEVRRVLSNEDIKSDIEKMANKEFKSLMPLTYRKQIVSGANYFIKALATEKDGSTSHIHLRIYKPFRGPLELSAIRTNLDKHRPLEYFD